MPPTDRVNADSGQPDFARLVDRWYESLYRFAFALTRNEAEACDLTQETFYLWATKGGQLRDASKAKTWLFTTLYRAFLEKRRKQERFPHSELSEVESEIPPVPAGVVNQMDWRIVIETLGQIDPAYAAGLALFYLEDRSYQEIAEILQIPIGTVMSRISRGRAQLQEKLLKKRNG